METLLTILTHLYVFMNVPCSCLSIIHGFHGRLCNTCKVTSAKYTWYRGHHCGLVYFWQVPSVHFNWRHGMFYCFYNGNNFSLFFCFYFTHSFLFICILFLKYFYRTRHNVVIIYNFVYVPK